MFGHIICGLIENGMFGVIEESAQKEVAEVY